MVVGSYGLDGLSNYKIARYNDDATVTNQTYSMFCMVF